jgi:mRNA-degrading endonuclease toxin of MazEF toxin-antitoxin module
VLKVNLDPTIGHEQGRERPCIVVSRADALSGQRYRTLVVVVPVTGKLGLDPMYPVLQPYSRGLTKPSSALVDMIRGIDRQRITGTFAPLPHADLKRLDDALRKFLCL